MQPDPTLMSGTFSLELVVFALGTGGVVERLEKAAYKGMGLGVICGIFLLIAWGINAAISNRNGKPVENNEKSEKVKNVKNFLNLIGRALCFKQQAFKAIYDEKNITRHTAILLISTILAGSIGSWPVVGAIAMPSAIIYGVITWLLWFGAIWFFSKKFFFQKSSFSTIGLFRVLAVCSTPGLLRVFGLIVPLGLAIYPATAIWTFILSMKAINKVAGYNKWGKLFVFFILAYGFQVVLSSAIAVAASYLFGLETYSYMNAVD